MSLSLFSFSSVTITKQTKALKTAAVAELVT
jgi:hypothetical protein